MNCLQQVKEIGCGLVCEQRRGGVLNVDLVFGGVLYTLLLCRGCLWGMVWYGVVYN